MMRPIGLQAAGTAANAVVGVLLLAYLGRRMEQSAFGEYLAVLSVAVVALLAIEGGWTTFAYREAVTADAGRARIVVAQGLGHALLASVVLAACAWPIGAALSVALLSMGMVAATNLVSARLRGEGRFGSEAAWQVGCRILSALAIAAAITFGAASATGVFLAWGCALSIGLLVVARRWLAVPRLPRLATGYLLVLPLAAADLLSAAMFRADLAVLKLAGASGLELADYGACTRVNELALLLFAPVANVALRAVRLRAGDRRQLRGFLAGLLALSAACGAAAWLLCSAFASPLLVTLLGATYEAAAGLLPWTSFMLLFALPVLVAVQCLVAMGAIRWLLLSAGCGAILLAVAIPTGFATAAATGAATALALAHAGALVLMLAGLWRHTRGSEPR